MQKQAHHLTLAAYAPSRPPLRRTALALLIAGCFHAAHASPALPQVVHGQATFNQQGNLFSITNTPNTIINWQSFSVNPGEITRFIQQNANSSVLNRITGQDPSKILGSLQSNGKVFLINPNGVLFGRDARVDVAGLVASSLALSNQDFLAGKMNFNAGDAAGSVINQGSINAGSGGQILLIAPNVENSGVITAPNGDVLLAAGHSVQLADAANPDLRVVLSAPADRAINVGQIIAQGGRIGMAGALLNQRGVLNASSAVVGENGKIVLKATGKAVLEAGSVTTAANTAGKGGEVTVLGEQVGMLGNASVDASGATGGGTVLLGGDYQGKNPAIANARQVAVDSDASIRADALVTGDGGKVVVWGDATARVHGSMSARGGVASGNGGLVETSGHYLDVAGIRVDTSAQRGKRGNWLLDPYDIDVMSNSSGQLENFDQFGDAPATGSSTISAGTISGAQSNVTLQALHRITFNSAINIVKSGVGLTALAGESIVVNAPISAQGGNITLSANDATGGSAYGLGSDVVLHAGINTYGGAAYLSGASITSNGSGWVNVGNGNLTLRANNALGGINLGGGGDQLLGSGAYGQLVTLQADNVSFGGRLGFGGASGYAEVIVKPLTAGRQVTVGSKPGNGLGLTNDELNSISANTVTVGSATAGDLAVSAPVDLTSLGVTSGVRNLNLETGGKLTVSNMVALRQDGGTLRATAGGALSVDAGGGLYAGGTVSLVADNMTLGGAAQSISTAANGTVSLARRSNTGSIEVGGSAADSGTSLGLSTAELSTIGAPTIAIGSTDFAGTLDVKGGLDLTSLATLNALALNSGGGINLNSALAVAKDLTLQGGAISAAGAVNVGGNFLLDGGSWVQNAASLPAFFASSFRVGRGTFLRATGGDGSVAAPYQIVDVYGLQGAGKQINNTNYLLAGDIDARSTASWNAGAGFAPLFSGDEFAYTGIFDGGNHSIQGLVINGGANTSYFGSGLFSRVQGGTIRNLNMAGGSVIGGNNVGALVGNNSEGTLSNVSSSMAVSGNSNVGGLAGSNSGSISNASASGNVTGLAGGMGSGSVSGSMIGGLVGSNNSGGSISVARASGAVSGPGEQIGGLAGNNDGAIAQAYATGGVGGSANVGGLVGRNGGTIADAYATGAIGLAIDSDQTVTRQNIGGVIGWSVAGSSASRLYFSGNVSGSGFVSGTVGAVVGRADPGAGVGPAFFNYETSGTYFDQGGSSGRSTAQMQQQGSFGGFNFGENAVWRIYDGYTTPMLKAFLTPLQVTATGGGSKVYDGQLASFAGSLGYVGLTNGDLAANGTAGYGNALNVGTYALGGLWSTKYDISYAGSTTFAITPRVLTLAVSGSKIYDGALGLENATFTLGNTVAGDTLGVTGTAQFADKNAGAGKLLNASNIVLSGNELGNYTLASTASGSGDISRASLGVSDIHASGKVYDGTANATVGGTLSGVIGSDQVQFSGAAASFADKNVGSAKTVSYTIAGDNLAGSDAGNYMLAGQSGQTSADITTRTLNLAFVGVGKTYDGSVLAGVTISDDRVAGDVLAASASAAFGDKNAGSAKAVTVRGASLSGTDAGNYVLASTSGSTTADIAQRTLNLGFTGTNKVYDGGTAAAVAITDDRVSGDILSASATAAFGDKNAGSGKTVAVRDAGLSGTDAANYALANTAGSTTADITQRELNLSFTGVSKVYDGGTAASVIVGDNRIAGDMLTASASAVFGDKNAGSGKTVTVQNASLSGTDAGNYAIVNTGGTANADIAQRGLDLSFAAVNKVYDGTIDAALIIGDNRIAGDVLTASASAAFGDKNAGSGKTVTVRNASLSGIDAGNYAIVNAGGTATADITQRALDLSFTGINKVYDGDTAASVLVGDNRIAGDMLTASASAAFGDKNAAGGKTVTVQNASLSGVDAGNYAVVNTSGTATADITQRALDLSFTGVSKVYDGLTGAAVTIGDNRIAGDVLTASASAAFGDKNAGSGKTVTVQDASLSGTDAGNYAIVNNGGVTTADIAQRGLNLSFTGVNKVYDGATGAAVTIGDNRIAGDMLNASASAAFGDKNAGSGKTVTVQDASLSGTDAGNYAIVNTGGSTTASIAQRDLTLSYAGVNKVYDGGTIASIIVGDNRIAGDVLAASASAAFGDKNAGSGKTVTVQDASLSGTDAGNYAIVNNGGVTTADIAQRGLTLSFTGVNKVYDGATGAAVTIGDDRIAGDMLAASASAAFGDKNAGSGKTVTVQDASLSGTDAGNYAIVNTGGSTTASIAQRELTLSFAGVNKVYDGLSGAAVTIGDNRIAGDMLTASASAAFGDKNAGSGKTVTVRNASLSGADAGNYAIVNSGGTTSADIAQRSLNLSFAGVNKVYDGLTGAAVTIGDNRIAGDVLTASASAAFGDKNAGSGKTVTVQNASLSGSDAGNYAIVNTGGSTTANIAQRELTLSFAGVNKVYDGLAGAAVTIGDNRIAGDMLTASASAAFGDKNAGNGKLVTVNGASLSGTDAGNYAIVNTGGVTTADIAQRALNLGVAGVNKVYDGSSSAAVSISDNRIAGDVLTASANAAFADRNAGVNKTVTVGGIALAGADAGNYRLDATSATTTATIAQRTLNLGYTGVDKVYDGVTGAQVAFSDDRIAGDVLTASASAAFADKNAGTGKTVTVQNAALSGADAGNYRLASTSGATSASIARAALVLSSVSAGDKVYDGTLNASVSGSVAGVIGQDAVSLSGGSGTFADRNYGTGKTVNVSGFGLSGVDAGNYVLTSNSGVTQASIAQRALSTWIGANGGLWSDAANWEGGVVPVGANVLAADFAASTGSVVYTAAAGDTVLGSLSLRGGLNLSGGSLSVNNALTVANYAQSGGLLGGLGNVTVSNSFSQSGGAIAIGGNLAITQAAGDLRLASLTANSISLNAAAGAVSQSGAIVAASLSTQSQAGTVLNDAGNRIKTFSASNSGAGGIALTNTSAPDLLVLGSLASGGGDIRIESTGGIESHAINASAGNVSLIAHSPVKVQGAISGNDVSMAASTDVAFGDGARVNAARTISVTAGTGVTFDGAATMDVQSTGGINVLAQNGDLTAADTVRINSRGAPVSLLAPNGRVNVPASVLVAGPVTPPVVTPAVPPAVIGAVNNYVPAISEQYNPLNQITPPNNVTTPLLADAATQVSTKETPDDLKNSIKKTYCN